MPDQRAELTKQEAKRQADHQAEITALDAEIVQASTPIRILREAEVQTSLLESKREQLRAHARAMQQQFERDLLAAVPDEFSVLVRSAERELSAYQRLDFNRIAPDELNRLTQLKAWRDEAVAAQRDPRVTSREITLLVTRGQALLEAEPAHA
jgi:hypothetical protein